MLWYWLAIVAPFLYAITNHIDKHLLKKVLVKGGVGSLLIISSIFSIVVLPFIYCFHPEVVEMSLSTIGVLLLCGVVNTLGLICYLSAMDRDEASYVVPFYQLIPVFAFGLGYVFLGEMLTALQLLACALLISGALILSIERKPGEKIHFKYAVVILMTSASLFLALDSFLFKTVTTTDEFWTSLFWFLVAKVNIGGLLFCFHTSYRESFMSMMKVNGKRLAMINGANESLYIVAEALVSFATLLAPLALVLAMNALQPIAVLVLGIVLTLFLPKVNEESLEKRHLMQKIFGISLLTIGAVFAGL